MNTQFFLTKHFWPIDALTIASDDGERKVEQLLWIILLNADKTKYHGILTLRKFLSR